MNVDSYLISCAMSFYQNCGFDHTSVPMLVDPDVSALTKPEGIPEVFHPSGKVYVASAEQSFIQMWKDDEIYPDRFMALTPCVRMGEQDESHLSTFLKLELIAIGYEAVELTLRPALMFFAQVSGNRAKMIETNDGWDIEIAGIEVGSYGVRKMLNGTPYVYGTGIAEPRLSYALSKLK